jgi:hypothetical protein
LGIKIGHGCARLGSVRGLKINVVADLDTLLFGQTAGEELPRRTNKFSNPSNIFIVKIHQRAPLASFCF